MKSQEQLKSEIKEYKLLRDQLEPVINRINRDIKALMVKKRETKKQYQHYVGVIDYLSRELDNYTEENDAKADLIRKYGGF